MSVSMSALRRGPQRWRGCWGLLQGRLHQRAEERPSTSSSKVRQRPRFYQQSPNSAASVSMAARSAALVLPLPAPPSILAIRAERLQQEEEVYQQEEQRQRDIWDRQMRRRQASPEARRSGRKSSELSRERCSSRSRSPRDCERIARRETRLLPEVNGDYHICMLDPDIELIVNQAKAAIHSCQGPTLFYVGVSRYLMRRWLGGDALSFEQAHSSKWARLHVLSTHSHNVGDSEDALIKILRQDFGANCCVKPSLSYICGEPTR